MDWQTVLSVFMICAAYSIGKGSGRAEGRAQARREFRPLHFNVVIDGDKIGAFGIANVEVIDPPPDPPGRET